MKQPILLTPEDKAWLKSAFRQTGHRDQLSEKDFEIMKKQADEYIEFFSYINSLPENALK